MIPGHFRFLDGPLSSLDRRICVGRSIGTAALAWLEPRHQGAHLYACGISGTGKTRFLESLIFQQISLGMPLCIMDPLGDLTPRVIEYLATATERAQDRGFQISPILERFLILDLTDRENPVRINPLEDTGEESEAQVDDLLRALERLVDSPLQDQRRIRNVLRGLFWVIAELNRLPPPLRPRYAGRHRLDYPLTVAHAAEFLTISDEDLLRLIHAIPETGRQRFRRQFAEFFSRLPARDQESIRLSTWNLLQFILDDTIVARALAPISTFSVDALLRDGISLVCRLPIEASLTGAKFVGKLILTKLQHAAYRRPERDWPKRYSLLMDEFHLFADDEFGVAMTNLRKYGISVLTAHQSASQPPFQTVEGRALLRTIRGNSRTKVLFRLEKTDAVALATEIFAPTERRVNFEERQETVTEGENTAETRGSSRGTDFGTSHTESASRGWQMSGHDHSHSDREQSGSGSSRRSSESRQESVSQGRSFSRATAIRTHYFSIEAERELLANQLAELPDRQCFVVTEPFQAERIATLAVPDVLYSYQAEDLPRTLLAWQRDRLAHATPLGDIPDMPENWLDSMVAITQSGAVPREIRMPSVPDAETAPVTVRPVDSPFLD